MLGRIGTVCVALGLAVQCSAQSMITVKMGVAGNFFDPPTISALQGDTVTFLFEDMVHGVTQSSFDNPCLPLPGGFNSGLAGPGSNKTAPASAWSIQITNDTVPIYFFCQATRPLSHCGAGMVGVINPPSMDNFRAFLAAAKDVSATPSPTIQTILNGVGAFATSPPTQLPQDNSGLTTIFVTTTTAPTTTDSASAGTVSGSTGSSTNKGLLIGTALAGGIAVGVIAALAFLLIRTKMKDSRRQTIARTPWRSEQKGTGGGGLGFMSGKGKFMADPDKEDPDPFAPREPSFISGEGFGDRNAIITAWSGERGTHTHTAVNSPPGTASSFPLMVMSPSTPAGFVQGASGRGHAAEARSIASASTSSRGGTNHPQASSSRGLGHANSYSSAGIEATSSGEHAAATNSETMSHPLANVGATGYHSEGVHSPFSDAAAVPLMPPPPVALVQQSTGSSSAPGTSRHPDVNYQELAREVASLLSSQAQSAGTPPMSPPIQAVLPQAPAPAQPQQPQLTEKQRLQQHLNSLDALPEEQQYSAFPNPYSRDGSQVITPHRQPRQLPRPLPLVARNISKDNRNPPVDEDDVASSRVTIAESEPPEYIR